MKLILSYLKKHIWVFLLSTFFLALESVADLMQPTFMSYIVDDGIAHADVGRILRYGAVMLGIALVGAGCAVTRNYFASRTSQAIGKELRRDMYHNVQSLSLENIDRLQPASIITRITNDVTQVQEFINSSMRMMVKAPITCIGAVVLIIIRTPRQGPVILSIMVVAGLLILGNMKIGYPRFGRVQKALDKLNNVSREFFSSIRVVKAFNAEDRETEKVENASAGMADAGTRAMRTIAVFSPLIHLSVHFGIVILLWTSRRGDGGPIGQLMASVNYMTQVLFTLGMIANVLNMAARALASSERIGEVLDERPAQARAALPARPEIRGQVEFEDVSFTYAGASREALRQITFRVEPGETIGIIGPTGSGKTTLVNLVPRFYDAGAGRVRIDGHDVTEIDEKILRGAVAVVAQKALLFTGTIADNLRWGRADATDEELRAAAETACADIFINAAEKGYDTVLGQGGVNLSGGQKQRLSLARALVRRPAILILDDCTSALDARTEAEVLRRLRRSMADMTVLLISQRISTVMQADKVLCIEDGQVMGYGPHDALLAESPTYRAIYHSQIGGDARVS